jgi:hypothetical protein
MTKDEGEKAKKKISEGMKGYIIRVSMAYLGVDVLVQQHPELGVLLP